MKKIDWIIIVFVFVYVSFSVTAFSLPPRDSVSAFQCSGGKISIGDSQSAVLATCGEPTAVDSVKTGNIEEWTYNLGPTDLVYHLRFENGKLVKIESGEQGTW
jgi:hypothetical protein